MNETVHFLAHHGYWLLFGAILGRQACLPVPANLFLVAAGALARSGKLSLSSAVALSVVTFLMADLAWYGAGRRWGEKVLHCFCSFSSDPEACVRKAIGALARHGLRTLIVSKFVVGLDAVAAPVAGASDAPIRQFLFFDALGALLWSASYASLGFAFSSQLDRVAAHVIRMGVIVALVAGAALGYYVAQRIARWSRFIRHFRLGRITPEQLREKLNAGEDVLVVDLQGRSNRGNRRMAIPGAVRINPRRLEQYKDIEIAPSQQVVLYCDCPGEFTSARVALALKRRGVEHVRPLAGGLKAWRDLGFPVTVDVRLPPNPADRTQV
jgi:membrane protein DedA with SNARE-associated domain/rhodanese-related sulfurtransferase